MEGLTAVSTAGTEEVTSWRILVQDCPGWSIESSRIPGPAHTWANLGDWSPLQACRARTAGGEAAGAGAGPEVQGDRGV